MDSSFASFKDMHIPSREELHFKRKEESNTCSASTDLYHEDDNSGWTKWLGSETQKHSHGPLPGVKQEAVVPPEAQWPTSHVKEAGPARVLL